MLTGRDTVDEFGATVTPRRQDERRTDRHSGLPPASVANVIVHAVTSRNPAPRRVIGRDARAVAVLTRLLPHRLIYRLTAAR
ncbi:hypothetical protein E1262_20815 [Jiangella aurantiaca]|uniref:Short-chain dehydrogenase n=1 Tax=Jiangella aurantiaca TaxID=2530373 RepID=A0A4R5A746_9ACTN|nr:hypothetical protein [Jiangella aurantiaca]TDD66920.1 hypothetical protein E1262_20815 [Jiangella aurantiaca]